MSHFDFDCTDKTLLLVDNDPINLQLLAHFLKPFGFELIIARDGTSALEKAKCSHSDLIFLDVMMPDMNGFETCRRLKADPATRDIPVVYLSALDETAEKEEGFEAGGVDFVSKPFKANKLLTCIKAHLSVRTDGHIPIRGST